MVCVCYICDFLIRIVWISFPSETVCAIYIIVFLLLAFFYLMSLPLVNFNDFLYFSNRHSEHLSKIICLIKEKCNLMYPLHQSALRWNHNGKFLVATISVSIWYETFLYHILNRLFLKTIIHISLFVWHCVAFHNTIFYSYLPTLIRWLSALYFQVRYLFSHCRSLIKIYVH